MIGTQKDWLTNLLRLCVAVDYSSQQLAHKKANETDVGARFIAIAVSPHQL